MLGGMSSRRDHTPLALPHDDGVAVTYAREFARRPQAEILWLALRSHNRRSIVVRCTIALYIGDKLLVQPLLTLMPHHPPAEPFGKRQAHHAFRFLRQISGETGVIDMRMCQGEVLQWTAAQQPSPQLVPNLENVVGVHAAVDQRPAGTVVEQPAIDVIEHHRNRQPHPEQAGYDVRQFAICRWALNSEIQIIGHFFSGLLMRPRIDQPSAQPCDIVELVATPASWNCDNRNTQFASLQERQRMRQSHVKWHRSHGLSLSALKMPSTTDAWTSFRGQAAAMGSKNFGGILRTAGNGHRSNIIPGITYVSPTEALDTAERCIPWLVDSRTE